VRKASIHGLFALLMNAMIISSLLLGLTIYLVTMNIIVLLLYITMVFLKDNPLKYTSYYIAIVYSTILAELILREYIDPILLHAIAYTILAMSLLPSHGVLRYPNLRTGVWRVVLTVLSIILVLGSLSIIFLYRRQLDTNYVFYFILGPFVEGYLLYHMIDWSRLAVTDLLFIPVLCSLIPIYNMYFIVIALIGNTLKLTLGLIRGMYLDYTIRLLGLIVAIML